MAVNVVLNGVTYSIPDPGDTTWGQDLTDYFVAQASGLLQKAGGTFTLTAEVDFGATYGLKSAYFKSRAANPASAGQIRLGNTEKISWRNAANGANLDLTVNASNELTFDGVSIISSNAITSLTGDVTASGPGAAAATIAAGAVTNAKVSNTAAIAYSKLALTGSVVNADISGSAAIAYSKLNLALSIVNGDIAAAAGITRSKLASGTADHVVINDGSGVMSSEAQLAISRGGTGQSTASAAINALLPTQTGNAGKFLQTNGTAAAWASNPSMQVRIGTSGLAISANTTINWPNTNWDTASGYSAGTYTIPTGHSGKWLCVISEVALTSNDYLQVYVNGSKVGSVLYQNTANIAMISGSIVLDLTAGDTVTIRSQGANTLNYSAGNYQAKWSMVKQA